MAELDYISIKGFKSIANVERLALRPINVIIGPNGSGKSNFIGVFSFLHAVREGALRDYVAKAGGAEKVLHFGSKRTGKIEVTISFQNEVNQYYLQLQPTADDMLYPSMELAFFWDKSRYPRPYSTGLVSINGEAGISGKNLRGTSEFVREHLGRWRLYHFHDTSSSSPMKKTADINDNRFLRPDGSNLSAFLYFLQQKHPDSFKLISGAIRQVAPFFEGFVLAPQRLNQEKIRLEWKNAASDQYFDASSLSDGTMRFIALATLLLQPIEYRPSVVLVDEPELGLHPYAITLLASMIKQASRSTQVIVSTQSPLLLDHFSPEDVLVANLVNEATEFTRLNSESLKVWLEDFSLGQLWEKNEIGGRPGGA